MSQSLYIIQQQPTRLHLYGQRIGWLGVILFGLLCTTYGAWYSYTSGQVMQLECTSSRSPMPCQVTRWRQAIVPNERNTTIESIQSASIIEETFDGGTSYKLMLTTPQRTFEFPGVTGDVVQRSTQTINTFSQQVPAEPFKLEYNNQSSSRNWTIFWGVGTGVLILVLLCTPISVDWQFDTETGWLSANCRHIFWRHQYQKPLAQIQSIHWIEKVHSNYDGSTTSYTIDLITRSGGTISLVPFMWTKDWSRTSSKPVVTAISQILKQPIVRR
ncbi:hypothetical protein [Alkalinema sp. FACHB-956]|uniref:hypothetical protein n=1 Tax=Alkalinema sp. FACHB-956 TaxID=2692768 RepID=UPI00168756E7|nr:hypothetical protein [Alkalinema sp. FACHB-956]MBD2329398.1 hypothetical protein [Alkalinema sp. FACHB-956]